MRDYAKIAPTFWTGATGRKIRELGLEARVLSAYLLTNPHANMLGLYYVALPTISHESGLTPKQVKSAFNHLTEIEFAFYDRTSEFVWIPEMARWQIGESINEADKRSKGIQKHYEALAANPFLDSFFDRYSGPFKLKKRTNKPLASPIDAPSKGKPPFREEQEQEQEEEQEKEQEQEKEIVREKGVADFSVQATPKRELTEIQKVITVYKLSMGFDRGDKEWDRTFFARYARPAKELIRFMGGWKDAADCIEDTVGKIREWNPQASISIDTVIAKHAAVWKKDKQEREAKRGVLPGPSNGSMSTVGGAIGKAPELRTPT